MRFALAGAAALTVGRRIDHLLEELGLHECMAAVHPAADLIARNIGGGLCLHIARMTRKKSKPLPPKGAAKVIPESPAAADEAVIVEHPDGYYWLGPDGDNEFGPFESRLAAQTDRDRFNEEAPIEGETVQEAEREIGLNDWIDAETGSPAEGQSPPHLEEP